MAHNKEKAIDISEAEAEEDVYPDDNYPGGHGYGDSEMSFFFNYPVASRADGCLVWLGPKSRDGYGIVNFKKKKIKSHRLAWALSHTSDFIGSFHVLHRCDNRLCVNPDHLFLGTNADNVADRHRKGRSSAGEGRPGAKLTWDKVRAIRNMIDSGTRMSALARAFGVSHETIRAINLNKKWKI